MFHGPQCMCDTFMEQRSAAVEFRSVNKMRWSGTDTFEEIKCNLVRYV